MDQAELDAAYDQIKYAPNLPQIVKRYATNSEAVRARLGAPRRYAYGPTAIEALDVYTTKRLIAEGYNHFEIPETLANSYGLLGRAVLAQMNLTQG